jgi:hypothetical protein
MAPMNTAPADNRHMPADVARLIEMSDRLVARCREVVRHHETLSAHVQRLLHHTDGADPTPSSRDERFFRW